MPTKCEGAGCHCAVNEGVGSRYCSEACRRNSSDMAGPCPCGHPECTEKAPPEM